MRNTSASTANSPRPSNYRNALSAQSRIYNARSTRQHAGQGSAKVRLASGVCLIFWPRLRHQVWPRRRVARLSRAPGFEMVHKLTNMQQRKSSMPTARSPVLTPSALTAIDRFTGHRPHQEREFEELLARIGRAGGGL